MANYAEIRLKHAEIFDNIVQHNVTFGVDHLVTLFRSYGAVDKYLSGDEQSSDRMLVYSLREDSYQMYCIGNRSYLKLYTAYRRHTVYGMYVGWMVHI